MNYCCIINLITIFGGIYLTLKWQKDPEYLALVEDLLDHELVQKLEMYKHHHVTNRLLHSLSVSYRSYRWAKRLKLNTKAIARAGLLHDLFFYDCETKHEVGGKGHNFEHPRIALENAKKLTELSELECDIILKHMAGATRDVPKYAESWIVTLMDKHSCIAELTTGAFSFIYRHTVKAMDIAYNPNQMN